jgi:hypothetical protein
METLRWTLKRKVPTESATLGELLDEHGQLLAFTLEDPTILAGANEVSKEWLTREKVYGKTAIPAGRYRVVYTYSQRFQKQLPLIIDVPYFTGIRLHGGKSAENTDGCVLLGAGHIMRIDGREELKISNITVSRVARAVAEICKKGPLTLDVVNP